MTLDATLSQADANLDGALERLFELLRIESISTDPAYADDCVKAADWLVVELQSLGFEASRRDTTGHPMVVGHSAGEGQKKLFYGHYDVQPVDPLELWSHPPFDPVLEDREGGKVIRARGASDDKGQLMTFIEACRAWKEVHGSLPANMVLLFEGEEESGSPSLVPFLRENADELRADIGLVCDTGLWNRDTPAISTKLRGLVSADFTIKASDMDLHSGMYGGAAINPIRVLTKILGGLHDDEGRVTLPGFYDGVAPLSNEIKDQWESLNFDSEAFLNAVGLSVPAGEKAFSTLEQLWSRPTCDINGISGGYTGKGFKTVLPSEAHAKLSFRLVGEQDPKAISAAFKTYVEQNLPADCEVSYHSGEGAPATSLNTDQPEFVKSREALSAEWPNEAIFGGCGGSIPIVGLFQDILGLDSILIGFGLEDDLIHSPNEKYDLRCFHKGIRSWIRVLDALT